MKFSNLPNDQLFNDPKYQKFREEWAASQLGSALEGMGLDAAIRMISERADEADFELRVFNKILRFQFTEVQTPNRRRGKEYRERKKNPMHLTPYEPQRGMQEGPKWIAEAVTRKVEKAYAAPVHLLVYANFVAESLEVDAISDQCSAHAGKFLSLWVLEGDRVVQVWQSKDTQGWASEWVMLPNVWDSYDD